MICEIQSRRMALLISVEFYKAQGDAGMLRRTVIHALRIVKSFYLGGIMYLERLVRAFC